MECDRAIVSLFGLMALLYACGCAMRTFYVVEADSSKRPFFPELCVVCGMPGPEKLVNATVTDEASRVDFYLYGLPLKPAQGPQLDVPVHDSCAKAIRNRFLREATITAMIAALFIAGLGIYGKHLGAASAIGTTLLVAFLILQATRVVPFEFNRAGTHYILMFGDREYAEKVAALNGTYVRTGTDRHAGS